jgi:acetyltransferase-like isoleucine patch superfamily enzyme
MNDNYFVTKCYEIIVNAPNCSRQTDIRETLVLIKKEARIMSDLKLLFAKGLKIILNPPALRKCKIDKTSKVCSKSELSNVKLGRYSYIGNQCFIVNTQIGNFCSIADRCSIGGAMHPIDRVSSSPVFHGGKNVMKKNFTEFPAIKTPVTTIENDVWLGMGCYIKAGVTIHNGAVIGMGSVVTHDIPAYEIWAGNPARKIKDRLPEQMAQQLAATEWWNWSDAEIQRHTLLFENVEEFLSEL